jgi:photosystem II stability/assembly factor-like uncharacterized protein
MTRLRAIRRPSRIRLLAAILAAASAASAAGDLDPAHTETWRIPEPDLFAVALRGNQAWAVGYWGSVLRSEDGGATWSDVSTPTDATLYDVAFADENHGWAVGAGGTLLRTTDGGRSWTPSDATVVDPFDGSQRPLDSSLFGVAAVSPTEAWAVGDFGVVLHTLDGSAWSGVPIPQEAFGDDNIPDRIFNAVKFTNRDEGWIAGEFGTTLRTADGGETWVGQREIQGAIDDIYLFDVAANGAGDALASGVGGVAIGSRDGGSVWANLRVPTTAGLFGTALDGERGLLVGDRGVLMVSRDGGSSWHEPARPRSFNWLRGVAFGPDGLALAVGEGGLILRSTDGGESWERAMGHAPPPASGVSVPEPPRALPTRGEAEDE